MQATNIDNLVGILNLRAPGALQRIQDIFPGAKVLLDKDPSNPPPALESLPPSQAAALLDLTRQALDEFKPLIEPAIDKLRKKLSAANFISLVGQLVAALGTSGTVVVLMKMSSTTAPSIAAMTSLVAFAGTVLAMALQYMRSDLSGTENGASRQYAELRDASWQIRVSLAQLEVLRRNNQTVQLTAVDTHLIAAANALAGRIHRLLIDIGCPISSVK